ncbi:kinase-like domain-containing protein [Rhizophagus clarus]|nr:kinase-like domain-containing protein [Rhizophagus clarus]
MIMWMLSVGERPYYYRPHDRSLINDIISGLRPKPAEDSPSLYVQLMEKCLSADPHKRPSAFDIYVLLEKWVIALCDGPIPHDISTQFSKSFKLIPLLNSNAIYYSRNLNFI